MYQMLIVTSKYGYYSPFKLTNTDVFFLSKLLNCEHLFIFNDLNFLDFTIVLNDTFKYFLNILNFYTANFKLLIKIIGFNREKSLNYRIIRTISCATLFLFFIPSN